jgi:hypothetical protein
MTITNQKQHIRALIAQGKIEQAFQELSGYSDNSILLLQARYARAKKEMNSGIIADRDYQTEMNRLNSSILSLLDNLSDEPKAAALPKTNFTQTGQKTSGKKLKVFYSYAHTDKAYLLDLQKHLKVLENTGKIETWHDGQILPGAEWDDEILEELNEADIILFLVSADFLASDYIWRKEITQAMERRSQGKVVVVPIIIKPCLWKQTDFAKLQALPMDPQGRMTPVSKWEDRDEAMAEVAEGLQKLINSKLK